jgi:hypothetical protein
MEMHMNAAIEREIRILKVHATASTAAIVALCVLGFTSADDPTTFEVITVERINVVESDGGLRLVISNSARQHPGIVDDEEVPRSSPRPPGKWVLEAHSTPSWQVAAGGRPGRRRRGSPVGWVPWPRPGCSLPGIQVRPRRRGGHHPAVLKRSIRPRLGANNGEPPPSWHGILIHTKP